MFSRELFLNTDTYYVERISAEPSGRTRGGGQEGPHGGYRREKGRARIKK